MQKQLSILIPVFYGEEIFEKCLIHLYFDCEEEIDEKWEILAYNNGFDPNRLNEIRNMFPKVKFYGEGENIGFAKGNNFLLDKAKGKYILLLNQDVFINKEAITRMIEFLEKNDEYSCVAPQLQYEDKRPQYSCRPFPTFKSMFLDAFSGGKKYRFFYPPEKTQEVDQPMASCLLWKGEILKKLKGFDDHPHFFLYFNDTDLSYRLKKEGGKSYFLSDVIALHLHGNSTSLLPELRRLGLWYKGLGRFWYKMGDNYILAYTKAFVTTIGSGTMKVIKSIIN